MKLSIYCGKIDEVKVNMVKLFFFYIVLVIIVYLFNLLYEIVSKKSGKYKKLYLYVSGISY